MFSIFFNLIINYTNCKQNVSLLKGRPIGKFPRVNDIIGAPSIKDGLYYRAKVLHKYSDVKYYVQFIDLGHKEYVHLSVIVTLTAQLIQVRCFILIIDIRVLILSIIWFFKFV